MSEKFNEAFSRYERDVDTSKIESFHELKESIEKWMGHRWKGSQPQVIALKDNWQKLQQRYEHRARAFSPKYSTFQGWQGSTIQVTTYRKRIMNYLNRHPSATLREARGHAKR